jgi:hypothetical protein
MTTYIILRSTYINPKAYSMILIECCIPLFIPSKIKHCYHFVRGKNTSHVTRTTVAYGSWNQNAVCSCGILFRSRESVVRMYSTGSLSKVTGLRALLVRHALLKGTRASKPSLTIGHRSFTSSTALKRSTTSYVYKQYLKHRALKALDLNSKHKPFSFYNWGSYIAFTSWFLISPKEKPFHWISP